jgi:hypothetical protein
MWGVPTVEIQKKVESADIFYPEGMPVVTRDIIGQLLKRKWQKRLTIDGMMEHPFFHKRYVSLLTLPIYCETFCFSRFSHPYPIQ